MATTKKTTKRKPKTLISVEETLYRFILDDYDHHAILESAVVAIAKRRAKGQFTKDKAIRLIGIVVSDARRWYSRHVEKLPRLRPQVRDVVANHLYNTEESHIKRLTSYYKNVSNQ